MDDKWEDDGDPWTVKSVTQAHSNDWFRVESNAVVRPDGADGVYSVVRVRRLAVGILPFEADGSVHLVGQWRFPLGRYSWEMPEGGAEPGEDALASAKRELEEESGLTAGSWTKVLEMDLSNSLTDEQAVIFVATDLKHGKANPEGTEVLKHKRAHFLEVLERVGDGRIRDAMTVAAVLRAHHMAVTGQLPAPVAAAMLRQGE